MTNLLPACCFQRKRARDWLDTECLTAKSIYRRWISWRLQLDTRMRLNISWNASGPCLKVFLIPLTVLSDDRWLSNKEHKEVAPLHLHSFLLCRIVLFLFFSFNTWFLLRNYICRNYDCEARGNKVTFSKNSLSKRAFGAILLELQERRDHGSYVIIKQSPATGPPSRRATPIH